MFHCRIRRAIAHLNTTLPLLFDGWSYRCVSEDNYRKIDGTGWIPVDFTGLASPVFSSLPVDPVNQTESRLYYAYVRDWEIYAGLESNKYSQGGAHDKESGDGGDKVGLIEMGSNVAAAPAVCGDINQDGLLDEGDVVLLGNIMFSGAIAPSGVVTDLNEDVFIDLLDLGELTSLINGISTPPACLP